MRNSIKVLTAALLGVGLCGVGVAQDNSNSQGQTNRQPRFEGGSNQNQQQGGRQNNMGKRPGNPDSIVETPKVQEEMKRHGEVMKGLMEEMKSLREQVKKEMESKMGKPQGGPQEGRGEMPDRGGCVPGNRGSMQEPPEGCDECQPPPEPAPKTNMPQLPSDREGGGQFRGPDEQEGCMSPNQGGGQPQCEIPDEIKAILEPFQSEAEQVATKIVSEFITHYGNLEKIVSDDQQNIKASVAKKLLMPPPPPRKQSGAMKQNPQGGQESPGNPGKNGNR